MTKDAYYGGKKPSIFLLHQELFYHKETIGYVPTPGTA